MSKCPVCKVELTLDEVEGVRVFRCVECRGVLLQEFALNVLLRQKHRDDDSLKKEAEAEFRTDTVKPLRCPRCMRQMDKVSMATRYTDVKYDRCKGCGQVWFDGGEIAMMRLLDQHSRLRKSTEEMRARARELESNPERLERFEKAVKRLSDRPVGVVDETRAIALHDWWWIVSGW